MHLQLHPSWVVRLPVTIIGTIIILAARGHYFWALGLLVLTGFVSLVAVFRPLLRMVAHMAVVMGRMSHLPVSELLERNPGK